MTDDSHPTAAAPRTWHHPPTFRLLRHGGGALSNDALKAHGILVPAAERAIGGGGDREEGQRIAGRLAAEAERRASPGDYSREVVVDLTTSAM